MKSSQTARAIVAQELEKALATGTLSTGSQPYKAR